MTGDDSARGRVLSLRGIGGAAAEDGEEGRWRWLLDFIRWSEPS